MLPDFLLVGAARSGTTSLCYYLRQHPDIYLPERKDRWFLTFAGDTLPEDPVFRRVDVIRTLEEYSSQFRGADPSALLGECSTVYLYQWERTIDNITKIFPEPRDVRIIVLLRDPIERAYSHYLFDMQEGAASLTFDEAVEQCIQGRVLPYRDYLGYGLYASQVEAYQGAFDHVWIGLTQDLETHPDETVRDLLGFLGVSPDVSIDTNLRANIAGVATSDRAVSLVVGDNPLKRILKPLIPELARQRLRTALLRRWVKREPINEGVRTRLQDYFREDVRRLATVIGRDLSGWLAP